MSGTYILILCALIFVLVFAHLFRRIRMLKKKNAGILHVLDKSEGARADAEGLKREICIVLDGLPEGFLLIDKSSRVAMISSRAAKYLDVSRRQVLNRPVLELGHLPAVKKIIFPLLSSVGVSLRKEVELKKNLVLELTVKPLVLGKNNTATLIIINDTSKSDFSVIAHQLKSPLSASRVALKMLLDQKFGNIKKEQRLILEKIFKEQESLIGLVNSLLLEAQTSESKEQNNKVSINLEDLVQSIAQIYRDEIKRKRISFTFNRSQSPLPKVLVNSEKIGIVIQNLLDNAVKYTPASGKIAVGITSRGKELEFYIKDSGIGIPENQKSKIFQRFSRGANAAKSKSDGSGLGLSIAKEIVESNGGRIWFESKENKGSTFFFSLPVFNN